MAIDEDGDGPEVKAYLRALELHEQSKNGQVGKAELDRLYSAKQYDKINELRIAGRLNDLLNGKATA
jgi:hypothetical protein